jgi:hypothetical protein
VLGIGEIMEREKETRELCEKACISPAWNTRENEATD